MIGHRRNAGVVGKSGEYHVIVVASDATADRSKKSARPIVRASGCVPFAARAELSDCHPQRGSYLLFGSQSSSAQSSLSWIGTESSLNDMAARWRLDRKDRSEPLRVVAVIVLAGSFFLISLALMRTAISSTCGSQPIMAGNAF